VQGLFNVEATVSDITTWVRRAAGSLNAALLELSSVTNTITAGSTQTQAGATALALGFSRVSSASANDGVRLPQSSGGGSVVIRNDSGAAIKVWPPLGSKINDGTANAADTSTIADNAARKYQAIDSTNWYTVGNS
jgi:hypothetical protein